MAIDPKGRYLVSGGKDWTTRLWSLKDGSPIPPAMWRQGFFVEDVAIDPAGERFASAVRNGTAQLVRYGESATLELAPRGREAALSEVEFSLSGESLFNVSDLGAVRVFGSNDGERISPTWSQPPRTRFAGLNRSDELLLQPPDGAARLVSCSPSTDSVESLSVLARMLSSSRLDGAARRRPLSRDLLAETWNEFAATRPARVEPLPDVAKAQWNDDRIRVCRAAKLQSSLLFHLDRRIEIEAVPTGPGTTSSERAFASAAGRSCSPPRTGFSPLGSSYKTGRAVCASGAESSE